MKKFNEALSPSDPARIRARNTSRNVSPMMRKVIGTPLDSGPDVPTDVDKLLSEPGVKKHLPAVLQPPLLDLPFGHLAAGFYLCSGEAGMGKTITLLALTIWCNHNKPDFAQYFSITEPRSIMDANSIVGLNGVELTRLPTRLEGYVNKTAGLVVVDSVGFAMRVYERDSTKSSATMKEGMEVQDQAFCRALQNLARPKFALFGIVGLTEVPFVDNLEGLCEGMVKISAPGRLLLRYRGRIDRETETRARSDFAVNVPQVYVEAAAKVLGY